MPELRSCAGCTTRCNFWGGLPAQASPGPSGRKTPARLLLHQSPTEGGGCACFSEFLPLVRSSESLLLPDLRFLTTRTGFTSRRRSPRDFPSLKSQRRSKPCILAGCSARRSPHRPALRRSTSIYSGGARLARRRVVFPSYELICATFQVREGNLPRYNLRERGCGHVVHEALVFSFASTGPAWQLGFLPKPRRCCSLPASSARQLASTSITRCISVRLPARTSNLADQEHMRHGIPAGSS